MFIYHTLDIDSHQGRTQGSSIFGAFYGYLFPALVRPFSSPFIGLVFTQSSTFVFCSHPYVLMRVTLVVMPRGIPPGLSGGRTKQTPVGYATRAAESEFQGVF